MNYVTVLTMLNLTTLSQLLVLCLMLGLLLIHGQILLPYYMICKLILLQLRKLGLITQDSDLSVSKLHGFSNYFKYRWFF